ncbi:hypothetical protein [Nocardioides cynanchi]|uniref:hypothetical protein n=1 Tax=Nocardioides cynanchi TaxID=2558918 RepID=UPI0017802079|nr:hypothetical protein [Nocardioides cynanchi]
MRTSRILIAAGLVTGLVVAVAVTRHHVVRREAAVAGSVPVTCTSRALSVLEEWDRRRARAWASGRPRSLVGLYTTGSRTAARDAALLDAYRARGLRVRSMGRQVLAVHVRTCRPRRLVLLVTDRLVDAVAVGGGVRTGLPPGRPTRREVRLLREGGRWRVSEVYER